MATVVATGATPVGDSPFANLGQGLSGVADVITGRREKKADEEIRRAILAAGGDRRKLLKVVQSEEFQSFMGNASPEAFKEIAKLIQEKPSISAARGTNILAGEVDPDTGQLPVIGQGQRFPTPAETEAAKAKFPAPEKTDLFDVFEGQRRIKNEVSDTIRGAIAQSFGEIYDPATGKFSVADPQKITRMNELAAEADNLILEDKAFSANNAVEMVLRRAREKETSLAEFKKINAPVTEQGALKRVFGGEATFSELTPEKRKIVLDARRIVAQRPELRAKIIQRMEDNGIPGSLLEPDKSEQQR